MTLLLLTDIGNTYNSLQLFITNADTFLNCKKKKKKKKNWNEFGPVQKHVFPKSFKNTFSQDFVLNEYHVHGNRIKTNVIFFNPLFLFKEVFLNGIFIINILE